MDAKTGSNLKNGQLTVGDKSWSFPIYEGTIGPDVLDIGLSGDFSRMARRWQREFRTGSARPAYYSGIPEA